VHFIIAAVPWHIAGQVTLRAEIEMLGVGSLLYLPSHSVDDVSTPVFDRALVIVIPFHIPESV